MSDVVVSQFITLDGVIESPGPEPGFEHAGWAFQFERGPEVNRFKFTELMSSGALLLGRVTYEGFAQAWPTMEGTGEFGEKMNSMPKYVVSNTLTDSEAEWNNSTVIRGDVTGQIAELMAQTSGDVLVAGSCRLVQSLAESDLVDEYRIMVFPIILGSGRRLFAEGASMRTLQLMESKTVGPDGVIILTYQPVRAA